MRKPDRPLINVRVFYAGGRSMTDAFAEAYAAQLTAKDLELNRTLEKANKTT